MSTLRREAVNQRIKELAEQAGYTKDMFGVGHWDMPECKKFAELIIRECADIATLNQFQWDATGNYVLEHFDFEEKL